MKKKIAIIGATGSIGKNTLDVITQGKDDFEVVLLSAHNDREGLDKASRLFPNAVKILSGEPGGKQRLLDAILSCGADIAINGISGAAGLEPSLAVINSGSDLALANKETMVMAGPLINKKAEEKNVKIIPVDSEHSAIFHLLAKQEKDSLEEIILTASGGPFLDTPVDELKKVKTEAALAHPTWNMGRKISIDSATMANKGLEVIEAVFLFRLPPEKIKVLIHRQSIVHAMVRMKDGVVYAQLSKPDMRLPIHKAIYWPQTIQSGFGHLGFDNPLSLTFCPADLEKFPMLALAYQAVRYGGLYPCAYNAANETAVNLFLIGHIGFLDIERITRYVLDMDWSSEAKDIESILEADRKASEIAKGIR